MARALQAAVAVLVVAAMVAPAAAAANRTLPLHDTVTIKAAAVSRTPDGLVGSTARIDVTVAGNGSGHVFMDTSSFTQVDMQGSAKLATRVAASVTGHPQDAFDYFFVVDTPSPIIGGPSAGAEMTVAAVAAMMGWEVDDHAVLTGTINLDGTVGPVGGIPEKAQAARDAGAGLFLFPRGQANATTGGGEQVHVPTYCDQELGITCEPVDDVREAVAHMTGHSFPRPEPQGNVTGRDYRETLRPLGPQLVDRANGTIDDAQAALASSDVPDEPRSALEDRLEGARDRRDAAVSSVAEARYYTGASRAFQATVEARTVLEAARAYDADDPDRYFQGRFGEANRTIQDAESAAGTAVPEGLTQLQAVGAAESRVLDAERRLVTARQTWAQAQDAGDLVRTAGALAFAVERAETVHWWLRIGDAFPPGPAVNETDARTVARDIHATARDTVSYAGVLSQRGDQENPLVQQARDYLTQSRRAQERGFHAAAIYDALQAEAWASTGVATAGLPEDVVDARANRSRDRAGAAIHEARAAGVEPILAEAYYEFAGDMDNPVQALAYYGLASTIARSTEAFQAPDEGPNPSRFVGLHPDAQPPAAASGGTLPAPDAALGLMALSFAAGAGVALASLMGRGGDGGREW